MIPFNIPLITGKEIEYINQAIKNKNLSGDGYFTQLVSEKLINKTKTLKVLLTTSCTHALEMAAMLIDIQPGDEVIMPSFTFVSTSNPFVLRGAKIIFIDIRPDTMNIDEELIEPAITERTKAIVPVHYAGVGCEMDKIMNIAEKYNLWVVEDAAQGMLAYYNNKHLGSFGHLGCISFHNTKNINCGEGGALLINDDKLIENADIIREKGTNRSKFLRGEIDKYTWIEAGSSYLPSELNAAFLLAQLEQASKVTEKRIQLWNRYYHNLKEIKSFELQIVPTNCMHNGHLFYIKLKDIDERQKIIEYLKKNNIQSVFHYIPLHSSKAGLKYCVFNGKDIFTTKESERLLRLPMYYDLNIDDVEKICNLIKKYFNV